MIFQYRTGTGWIVDNVIADPLAFEDFMPYRPEPAKYRQPDAATLAMLQLLSGSPVAMRLVIDEVEEKDSATPEFLDAVAQLLLDHRADAMDERTADIYAWMCVLLRRDGGARYQPALDAVAKAATTEHLRKHASARVENRNPGAAPYADGAVSIAALRARYVSIYPQRKLTAGYF